MTLIKIEQNIKLKKKYSNAMFVRVMQSMTVHEVFVTDQ